LRSEGCAAGWVIGLVYVALAVLFPGRHLPRVFALLTSVWGVATFAGPLVGGLFADAGSWRGVFWLFAGQAVCAQRALNASLASLSAAVQQYMPNIRKIDAATLVDDADRNLCRQAN